jgi:hypothetical protein
VEYFHYEGMTRHGGRPAGAPLPVLIDVALLDALKFATWHNDGVLRAWP